MPRSLTATISVAVIGAALLVLRYHSEAEVFAINGFVAARVVWLTAANGPPCVVGGGGGPCRAWAVADGRRRGATVSTSPELVAMVIGARRRECIPWSCKHQNNPMDDASMEPIVGRSNAWKHQHFIHDRCFHIRIADLLAHGHASISIQIGTMLPYEGSRQRVSIR